MSAISRRLDRVERQFQPSGRNQVRIIVCSAPEDASNQEILDGLGIELQPGVHPFLMVMGTSDQPELLESDWRRDEPE